MYSFILHLHMRLLQALICEPSKAGATMCLTAGEPSDLARVTDSAWANEWMEEGVRGGADGVTECLGTCHFVSVLASTSGLLSL